MVEKYLLLIVVAHLGAVFLGIALLRSPQFARQSPSRKMAIAGAMSAAMAVALFRVSEPRLVMVFSDFAKAYYRAGQAVLQHPDALIPLYDSGLFAGSFVNLPIVAYLFAPFGALPFWGASATFLALGIAMTLWAWALLARAARLAPQQRWILLFLFAANGPLLNSIREGNTSHMVLLGLTAGLLLLRRRQQALAGAVLGLCALIKLPVLIFGAYFLLRRNWKAAAGFSSILATTGLMSLLVFGWDLNWRWFELSFLQFGQGAIGAFNAQSIPGFLLRLASGAEILRNWSFVETTWQQKLIGRVLVFGMAVVAIVVCARRADAASGLRHQRWDDVEFCLVVVLAIVLSPLSWSHYYCWLLVPTAFFLGEGSAVAPTLGARRAAWTAIVLVTPVVCIFALENPVWAALYAKLAVSHLLAGGLLWFVLLIWALANACRSDERLLGPSASVRNTPR